MIKDRIIQLIEYKDIAKESFYVKIGMTSASFRGKAKNTPLNSNAIENILSEIPDTNPFWLLTGKGEMFIENSLNAGEKDDIITLQRKLIEKHEVIENLRVEITELKRELKTYKKAPINVENVPTANVG